MLPLRRPLRMIHVGVSALVLCLWFGPSDATIRIVDSGREYRSWPDQALGPQLAEGEIYKARLQQIQGNSHLCSDSPKLNWNITIPDDGLPVALYVKRGLCSFETKAQHASKYLPDVVQFLIIDGDHHVGGLDEKGGEGDAYATPIEIVDPPGMRESSNFEVLLQEPRRRSSSGYDYMEFTTSTSSIEFVSRALRRKKKKHPAGHDKISVSILHVSYATGYNLLDLLLREFPSTKEGGGTLIELTGDRPSGSEQQKKVVWLCFVGLMGMSGCLCLLSIISTVFEAAQPTAHAHSRPRRRRLTPWQVRNKFLLGVYDGSQVNFVPPKRHCRHDCENPAQEKAEGNEKDDNGAACSYALLPSPLVISDDTCTICLDEFNPGDKLRCLPCQHCFHSPCISRWLTERAATCPLCKIDLYESDDEDEEDEASIGQTPLSSSWNSVPPETRAAPTEHATQLSQPLENIESSGERWQRRGRALGSWSRSLFRRRRLDTMSLTEPLLPEGNRGTAVVEPEVARVENARSSEVAPSQEPQRGAEDDQHVSFVEDESASCPSESVEQHDAESPAFD